MKTLAEKIRDAGVDSVLLADGFDEAFIGLGTRCGQPTIAVYDAEKCLLVLMRNGMDHEEAREYFDFNVVGAWVGPETPVFVESLGGTDG